MHRRRMHMTLWLGAVLLIVLGLNIVFHSFSAYKKAEHNSEAKA